MLGGGERRRLGRMELGRLHGLRGGSRPGGFPGWGGWRDGGGGWGGWGDGEMGDWGMERWGIGGWRDGGLGGDGVGGGVDDG